MSAAKDFAPSAVVVPLAPLRAGKHVEPALSAQALALAEDARTASTRAAYAADWRAYCQWAGGVDAAVAGGATALANWAAHLHTIGRKPATVRRKIAGARAHLRERTGNAPDSAALRAVLSGAKRQAAHIQKRARPLTAEFVAAVVDAMPSGGLAAMRDKALLLVAWQAALRRSEAAALHWQDCEAHGAGMVLTIRQSKHRIEAETLPLVAADNPRYCPIEALRAWREALAPPCDNAPMFPRIRRGGKAAGAAICAATVGLVLRRWLVNAGINPSGFSAHSLRAGFLTSAALAGTPMYRLMEHSRHKRSETLDAYVREATRIASHPAKGLL